MAPEISDEEARRIEEGIKSDPDTQVWGEREFSQARPATEMEPDIVKAYNQGKIGRGPQKAPVKKQVTIRLDQEIIEHFKQAGKGWQSRLNNHLKKTIKQ